MKHKIKITEIYGYYIEVDADSKKEAIIKAQEYYDNADDNYTGVADANTLEKASFKIITDK